MALDGARSDETGDATHEEEEMKTSIA